MKPVHFMLAGYGAILGRRDVGREIGADVLRIVHGNASVILDFNGVDVIAPSCFEEIYRPLRGLFDPPSEEPRVLVVLGLDEDVRATVEMVLERHKAAIAELKDHDLDLLTSVPHLADTLAMAKQLGQFTAPELAERMDLKLPNANSRLTRLVASGALEREPDPDAGRGKRFRYRLPDAGALAETAREAARPRAGRS